jgi:hypothetical protein
VTNSIGALGPADELFFRQTTDTFATVATSDPAWTEKVCAMALAADGSLQVGFGLGKYTNRDVEDAYAAISRGIEQITVRASRRLTPRPDTTAIGPISYEVLEPLRTVRFRLADNHCRPIAFVRTFEAIVPPQLEDRTLKRCGRVSADLGRYHQAGVASGWVSVDTAVRVTDPVGGGVGVGNCQPIVVGTDPALGLTNEDSFW